MKEVTMKKDVIDLMSKSFDAVKAASKRSPSDQIVMTRNDIEDLVNLVFDNTSDKLSSDIIWADTLPLRDFEISVTFPNTEKGKFKSITYRFALFQNNRECDRECDVEGLLVFGALITTMVINDGRSYEITCPLLCDHSNLIVSNFIYKLKENGRDVPGEKIPASWHNILFKEMAFRGMQAFYAVEVSLLNPVLETVFVEHSNTVPINTETTGKNKNKRAKVRYVKRHFIHMDDINAAFNRHGFVRHTNIWWVCGHWRNCKSGKRVFVPGYWKGPMRDLKNVETPRSREIAV